MNWSPILSYGVGLIATDGNLSGDRRHIEFTSKDLELVEHVRDCFGPRNRICTKGRGDGVRRYFRIQIGSVHLYQWLCSLGLTARKSLTLGPLDIPDEFFADFLRGHLDGDGNITSYYDSVFPNALRLYVRFHSASRLHLDWLQTTISRLWSLKGYQTAVSRAFRLNYAKAASIELLRHLYNAPDIPLSASETPDCRTISDNTCGSGGTGRRDGLRSRWPQGHGGSTPPFRTCF